MDKDKEFLQKQRHELALAWATSVFNNELKSLKLESVEAEVSSIGRLHDLYIFAYREYSNYDNNEFYSYEQE